MEYYRQFIEAIERTKSWGFDSGDITLDRSTKYINENSHSELIKLFEWNYDGLSDLKKTDCTNVSINMIELVKNLFSTDAYLTTGNLSSENGPFFDCSIEYLKSLAKDLKFNPKLKVHMWITLSSGEIVDFTFFRSMAWKYEHWKPMKSQILTSLIIDKLDLTYTPMIVGDDFYKRTGNLYQFKFKE